MMKLTREQIIRVVERSLNSEATSILEGPLPDCVYVRYHGHEFRVHPNLEVEEVVGESRTLEWNLAAVLMERLLGFRALTVLGLDAVLPVSSEMK